MTARRIERSRTVLKNRRGYTTVELVIAIVFLLAFAAGAVGLVCILRILWRFAFGS